MPPAPRGERISYGPRRLPAGIVISGQPSYFCRRLSCATIPRSAYSAERIGATRRPVCSLGQAQAQTPTRAADLIVAAHRASGRPVSSSPVVRAKGIVQAAGTAALFPAVGDPRFAPDGPVRRVSVGGTPLPRPTGTRSPSTSRTLPLPAKQPPSCPHARLAHRVGRVLFSSRHSGHTRRPASEPAFVSC